MEANMPLILVPGTFLYMKPGPFCSHHNEPGRQKKCSLNGSSMARTIADLSRSRGFGGGDKKKEMIWTTGVQIDPIPSCRLRQPAVTRTRQEETT
jgi:hypothetical protein